MKSSCQFVVQGMSLTCPLCDTTVQSGFSHKCEGDPATAETRSIRPLCSNCGASYDATIETERLRHVHGFCMTPRKRRAKKAPQILTPDTRERSSQPEGIEGPPKKESV